MFTRIDHVGLAVRDLDQAIAFYARTFDVQVVHEEVNEEQGVREAMLAVGDSGSCIQLLAPLRPDSPIAKFLERSGEGVQQVAYVRTRLGRHKIPRRVVFVDALPTTSTGKPRRRVT